MRIIKSKEFLKLEKKYNEIYSLTPNNLGSEKISKFYKYMTKPLKELPFVYIVPFSFMLAVIMYLVIGHLTISLATLLQYGF